MRPTSRAFCAALCSLPPVAALVGEAAAEAPALTSADPARVTPEQLKQCKRCHYETGVRNDPGIPHLAGQRASCM